MAIAMRQETLLFSNDIPVSLSGTSFLYMVVTAIVSQTAHLFLFINVTLVQGGLCD